MGNWNNYYYKLFFKTKQSCEDFIAFIEAEYAVPYKDYRYESVLEIEGWTQTSELSVEFEIYCKWFRCESVLEILNGKYDLMKGELIVKFEDFWGEPMRKYIIENGEYDELELDFGNIVFDKYRLEDLLVDYYDGDYDKVAKMQEKYEKSCDSEMNWNEDICLFLEYYDLDFYKLARLRITEEQIETFNLEKYVPELFPAEISPTPSE